MRKKTLLGVIICTVAAATLAVLVFNPFTLGMIRIFRAKSALSKPEVYEPVGKALAIYCQSDLSLFPESMGNAWLPEELDAAGYGSCGVREDAAWIELGGGFYHFGYRLARDTKASSHGKNVWQLYLYGENEEDERLLTNFSMDPGEKISRDDLVKKVIDGYDRNISRRGESEDAYTGKIQTYLRFDRVKEARQTTKAMVVALPDEWWPVLVNALVISVEATPAQGEDALNGWLKRNENFFSYMDAAYFYQVTHQPKKAADAMLRSTAHTANTEWGHDGNAEYRGYTAAMYAYQSGEYDAVVSLCDHLLKVTINGDYAKAGLRALRDAAATAKLQPNAAPTLTWASEINPFDPFESIDIEKLLGRPVPRQKKR